MWCESKATNRISTKRIPDLDPCAQQRSGYLLSNKVNSINNNVDTVNKITKFKASNSAIFDCIPPSYVPQYIRPVGFGTRHRVSTVGCKPINSFLANQQSGSVAFCREKELSKKSLILKDSNKKDLLNSESKRHHTESSAEVNVRTAVAAMEARITESNTNYVFKPPMPNKPNYKPTPNRRSKHSTPEGSPRKNQHRRSTSDPDAQVSFQKAKDIWNKKATTTSDNDTSIKNITARGQFPPNLSANRGTPSSKPKVFEKPSYQDPAKSRNTLGKENKTCGFGKTDQGAKLTDRNIANASVGGASSKHSTRLIKENYNINMTSVESTHPKRPNISTKPSISNVPSVPPRPNGLKSRISATQFQNNVGVNSRHVLSQATSLESQSSSVNEKAKLFGEPTKAPPNTPNKDFKKRGSINSPIFERRKPSSPELSTKPTNGNNTMSFVDRKSSIEKIVSNIHSNNCEASPLFKDRKKRFELEEGKKKENAENKDDKPDLQKAALLAKDQRTNSGLLTELKVTQDDKKNVQTFLRTMEKHTKTETTDLPQRNSRSISMLDESDSETSNIIPNRSSSFQAAIESITFIPRLPNNNEYSKENKASSTDKSKTPPEINPRRQKGFLYQNLGQPKLNPTEGSCKPTRRAPPPPPGGKLKNPNISLRGASPINDNVVQIYDEAAEEVRVDTGRSGSICSTVSVDSGIRTSLEVPKIENFDSDYENSDEDDSLLGRNHSDPTNDTITASSTAPVKEPNETKLHNIAKELLSTEESYVSVLYLIDQIFHKQVLEAAVQKQINVPEQVVHSIFNHIPAIYQFHSSFLLPQLKERLQNWETKPRIGDIMSQAGPFLKMYSLYVQQFDETMNTINQWTEKSHSFKALLLKIQKTPECHFLTLQHHMLSPVQRVPRYRLLLEDYMKRLPQDSDDKQDADKALQLITKAATHNNETMKKNEKFHQLMNIFNNLADVNFNIFGVSRELLKEGKITKISARNGEKYERYLYLLSDMLLCCAPIRRLQGKTYKVTAKIDLEGMKITQVKNPTAEYTFCVHGLQKSMELATNTEDEKNSWLDAIQSAINELLNRRKTFHPLGLEPTHPEEVPNEGVDGSPGTPTKLQFSNDEDSFIDISDAELGTRAPRWIKDQEVTMCMICSKAFNVLLRRRHHCRACGRVICGECSEHKFSLQYDPGRPQKICTRCYDIFIGIHKHRSSFSDKKGVLEVKANQVNEHSVIADYLYCCDNDKRKTWTKTWCVIPEDELCLYFYGAHQDIKAQMTLPLPGFELTDAGGTVEYKYLLKMKQGRSLFQFASNDQLVFDRWKYALTKASRGEDITREEVFALGKETSNSDSDTSSAD